MVTASPSILGGSFRQCRSACPSDESSRPPCSRRRSWPAAAPISRRTSQAGLGAATPGQPAGIPGQRRRPGVLRDGFLGAHRAVAGDARPAGPVAEAVFAIHLHRRRPCRRARHARIQSRARRPPRQRGARLHDRARASPPTGCARSPTARSGRSPSATTSPAGRRTAARSPCSTPAAEPIRAQICRKRPARRGGPLHFHICVEVWPNCSCGCRKHPIARSLDP